MFCPEFQGTIQTKHSIPKYPTVHLHSQQGNRDFLKSSSSEKEKTLLSIVSTLACF
jgi:hypothetical protein